jgi:DNA-binding NarL/FixJ family response regulator
MLSINEISIRTMASAPNYAQRALQAIVQIPTAANPPELLARLVNATRAIGAGASLYTAAIPESDFERSSFSLFACHPAFAHAQSKEGQLLDHPWLRFARTHTMPGTDHQILVEQSADNAAIDLARQFGFRSCLVIPTPHGLHSNRIEMLCLGSDAADDFEGPEASVVRTLARALAAELHDWLTRHLQQRLQSTAQLAATDVQLLSLQWRGLGTKEISQLTGLTTSTVDCRFQRIMARLHCPSRKAAASRAAAYGLLESI